jgi:hypothetical protein
MEHRQGMDIAELFDMNSVGHGIISLPFYPRTSMSSTVRLFGRCQLPQHFLYFFPLLQGQGSLRPIFGPRRIVEAGDGVAGYPVIPLP